MAVYPLAQINSSRVTPWLRDEHFAAIQGITVGLYRYQSKLFYLPEISEACPSSPCSPCCSGSESIWQSGFFGRDVLSFSRAADEVMCFLSGEIKRHIPQPDRKRELEWFPEKLLYVECKISNFYFGSRSISLLHLIIALLQHKFHYIHRSVHMHAYTYHGQGWDCSWTQNAKPDNILTQYRDTSTLHISTPNVF